jgi:hypothetical protein
VIGPRRSMGGGTIDKIKYDQLQVYDLQNVPAPH